VNTHLNAARQARKGLAKVKMELLAPTQQSLARCGPPLQAAIGCMEQIAAEIAKARKPGWDARQGADIDHQNLRAELFGLRGDLGDVNELMRNAARFYSGYAGLLGADAQAPGVDYSPAARLASMSSERPFLVHG